MRDKPMRSIDYVKTLDSEDYDGLFIETTMKALTEEYLLTTRLYLWSGLYTSIDWSVAGLSIKPALPVFFLSKQSHPNT